MKCCARGEIEDGTVLGFQMILYVYMRENLVGISKSRVGTLFMRERIMEGKEKNSKFCS